MKVLKVLAFILGGVVVLAVLLVTVALLPVVQTWAVRKAMAGQPGLTFAVGRVAAGFSAAEISDVRVVKDGMVITAKQISARYSAWDYLSQHRIDVDQLSAQGIVVDTRQVPSASAATTPATAAAAPFNGLLNLARLPFDVRLGRLDVSGRALLPAARTVDFTLQGGGIATGQRGQLEWKVDYSDPNQEASLHALHSTGTLTLHLAADRRIDHLDLENTAAAEGPSLPADRVRLEITAEQPAAGANEAYTALVSLLHQDQTEPLLHARMDYLAAMHELAGTWNVTVRSEQLAAVLAGFGLPEVALQGGGKFTYQPEKNAAAASGEINGTLSGWGKLDGQLASVGVVQLHTAFDGGMADNLARLNRLEIELTSAEGRKLLQIATAQVVSFDLQKQQFGLGQPGSALAHVTLQGLPLAWAQAMVKPVIIEGGEVSGSFALEAAPDGNRANLRTVQPLTFRGVTLRDRENKRELVQQLTLVLSPEVDYSKAKIAVAVPDLNLTMPAGDAAQGAITAEITNPSAANPVVAFSAQFQEKLVSILRPFLPFELPPLAVESAIEGRMEGPSLQLARFTSTVKDEHGALLAAVETLQPVTVNSATMRATAPKPAAAAMRIRFGALPLAWAEALLPKSKFAGALASGAVEVDLPAADQLRVQTSAPFVLRGIGATLDGQTLAQGLDAAVEFTVTKQDNNVSGEVRRFEVKQNGVALVQLKAAGAAKLGDKLDVSGRGSLEANLASLLKQPAFASSAVALTHGDLTAHFDIATTDTVKAKIALAMRHLTAGADNRSLGDLDMALDATVKTDGSSGTMQLPLTLKVDQRRSDLMLDGNFTHTASLLTLNGKLLSNLFVADDFQALAALMPATPSVSATPAAHPVPAQAPAPAPAANSTPAANGALIQPDTAPFWKGFAGHFAVELNRVQYGQDYTITGMEGAAIVDTAHLALDHLEGRFKGDVFKVAASITFSPEDLKPYALSAQADVPGFDAGAFLRAANPGEPPMLESTLTIHAKLNGRGETLPNLLQNAYGEFDLTGSKGVLRALSNRGSEVAGLASGALRLLGAIRHSDTATAMGVLTAKLNEMPFDQFTMQLVRDEDLNLKLNAMEFLSPEVHLTGNGTITYQPGVGIANQPLHAELQLAGKAEMATVLNKLYLLSGKQDTKGYSTMSLPFVVTGTLAKTDASQLWRMVGETAAKAAVGGFFR